MYKTYAAYYDLFYQSKDYAKEVIFLHQLLSQYHVKTILDVGCGTGAHLCKLEQHGYICTGIDLNIEMLAIARAKLKGKILEADMRSFDLPEQFDAIISMFAVFNHNLELVDAEKTLAQLKKHLSPNGIVLLDLYNPQASGKKVNTYGNVTRIMEWELNTATQRCDSIVKFVEGEKMHEEILPLKIYSMPLLKILLQRAGFTTIRFYDNYTFNEGSPSSKNLIVLAQ